MDLQLPVTTAMFSRHQKLHAQALKRTVRARRKTQEQANKQSNRACEVPWLCKQKHCLGTIAAWNNCTLFQAAQTMNLTHQHAGTFPAVGRVQLHHAIGMTRPDGLRLCPLVNCHTGHRQQLHSTARHSTDHGRHINLYHLESPADVPVFVNACLSTDHVLAPIC